MAAELVASPTWEPDSLPGFEQLTLPLPSDEEGAVVATLVRQGCPPALDAGVDLLYVHGWYDYFFQTHLAHFWADRGARFYALDLRKYGRSLRDHQTPGYTTSLRAYGPDIAAALNAMGYPVPGETPEDAYPQPNRKLVLMGHSTGGLVLSLWLHRHPGVACALVLNSPYLEFQTGALGRRALEGAVKAQARVAPRSQLISVDPGFYTRSISDRFEGEWHIDDRWRPDDPWRPTPAWLAAVLHAQDRVARGLSIKVPVFVALSARSTAPLRWSEEMRHTDTVLDVQAVAERATALGSLVTVARFDGALHDVTLSTASVRQEVFTQLGRWCDAYVAPVPSSERTCATMPGTAAESSTRQASKSSTSPYQGSSTSSSASL